MRPSERGDRAAARSSLQEAELQEVRLVDVLDRVRLLAQRRRERVEADRAAGVLLGDRPQQLAIEPFEPRFVDLEQLERFARDRRRDHSLVTHLGHVSHATQDPVADARRAARAAGDLVGGVVGDLDAEDPGRAADDRRELAVLVVVEPERDAEAVAQRRREEPRARRRADERERRQVERQRPRRRPLAHHDVEPEVLERRIEDLLGRAAEAVDLVDEDDVARLDRGEDRRDVLALERGAGDRADADAELLADDVREARLAEARRPDEQDVVERLATALRSVERDGELLLDAGLADELVEAARAETPLDLLLVVAESRRQELRGRVHAACFNASRTRSSGEQLRVDLRERALGVEQRPAELDECVARDDMVFAGAVGHRDEIRVAELLLQLEHDPLGRLLADAGDRLEARRVARARSRGAARRRESRRRSRARPSARRR